MSCRQQPAGQYGQSQASCTPVTSWLGLPLRCEEAWQCQLFTALTLPLT